MAVASPPRPAASHPALPPLPEGEWPEQGRWTYEDYLRLPDVPGRRYEILFGVLYMANTPDLAHQVVVTELPQLLGPLVKSQGLGKILVAPFEVRLSASADPVQPDLLFVRAGRRDIITRQYVDGAPDLVVEVLSPSTARLDRYVKFGAYEQAGVQEYWIVEPRTRSVEVYRLDGGEYALVGAYGPGEKLESQVLPGLDLDAAALFEE